MTKSCTLDRIRVTADDENGVSDAGLLIAATLGDRLGLGPLLREHLTVPGSAGANPDRKCLTLIHSLLAGGDCIEDVNALRAGSTGAVLGHKVAASSTVGTFLRSFGFGHARQLDAVTRRLLARAVTAGAHPGFSESVTVDIDSTLCETYGLKKDGARGVMRTGLRGYHPLLAVIAGTPDIAGVVAHARMRRGRSSDSTSAPVFIKETISRLRSAGAAGEIVLRADSGFYLSDVVTACRNNDVRFSITARMIGSAVKDKIAAIAESEWTPIDYFLPGAGVAEFTFIPFASGPRGKLLAERGEIHPVRLIVRRTPLTDAQAINRGQDPDQPALFPIYDYHPMITDRTGEIVEIEADHRRHAEVELTIRDLKHDMAMNHFPTKSFGGNAAWLILNTIAHNLTRWATRLGLATAPVMTKKIRRRIYNVTGRLVRTGRRLVLRLPRRWPWAALITAAIERLRALPAASG
ncbi:IS1380 family transposase [Nocardioides terrisoli]|uniref:IS1380 family transposase n=1 Tax=Nocardioides terrisoli TaxID=3388267 RepID=UPI00287B9A63|nr:IS1380 family transposase [Nocardioides marmorisolisilvae]